MDINNVGQGRQFQDVTAAYDAKAGTYNNPLPAMPTEAKLPTAQFPMGPAPMPFTILTAGTGER